MTRPDTGGQIPDANRAVVAAGNELGALRRHDRHRGYRTRVPGNLLLESEWEGTDRFLGAGGDEQLAIFAGRRDGLDGPCMLGENLLDCAGFHVVNQDQVIGCSGGDVGVVE